MYFWLVYLRELKLKQVVVFADYVRKLKLAGQSNVSSFIMDIAGVKCILYWEFDLRLNWPFTLDFFSLNKSFIFLDFSERAGVNISLI